MKKIEFKISRLAADSFFPKERIKNKLQILEILLEATRYMLAAPKVYKKNATGKIVLLVDKMSRLFFLNEGKYYSIAFPFLVEEMDKIQFSFNNLVDIDFEIISNILSVIKGKSFDALCSLDFADSIYDFESEFNENFWVVLRSLILNEDGYIRYDKDLAGYNEAKKKGHQHRHPIHHFDVCYSNMATYKIGLEEKITEKDFIDLLNIKSDCRYLK